MCLGGGVELFFRAELRPGTLLASRGLTRLVSPGFTRLQQSQARFEGELVDDYDYLVYTSILGKVFSILQ
jgi:hypothetical protein